MKKILAILLFVIPSLGFAGGSSVELDDFNVDLSDTESLKRGANIFAQYCNSCHSATLMRFSRIAKDLEMSDEEVAALLPGWAKAGEGMRVSMRSDEAKRWFGTTPPDLSVIARARKPEWIYTFLRGFYYDEGRALGVNNLVFKDVAMPAVLVSLQGVMAPVYETYTDENGLEHKQVSAVEQKEQGLMTTEEFDLFVGDLVNYLAYMGEPSKMHRQSIAPWVMLFLLVFFVIIYLLKKEYWKDIH